MRDQQRSYLDLFLDNSLKKKNEIYFGEQEEEAINSYNKSHDQTYKNKIYADIIHPCFTEVVAGVLKMPKFRRLPKDIDVEELTDSTYFRLLEKIHKFEEGMISKKSGLPVKAYSYFSTIAKNFVLESIKKHNKVLEHKADVETTIDLSILTDESARKISTTNVLNETVHGDYVTSFNQSKKTIIDIINNMILDEEELDKQDSDFLKIAYCLKYLLNKWHKIEFVKKSEFMRILTLFTGLSQQKVSFLFKKIKNEVLKKIDINTNKKIISPKVEFIATFGEMEEVGEEIDEDEEIIDLKDQVITEEDRLKNYVISSLDEFEQVESKISNIKIREQWKIKSKPTKKV